MYGEQCHEHVEREHECRPMRAEPKDQGYAADQRDTGDDYSVEAACGYPSLREGSAETSDAEMASFSQACISKMMSVTTRRTVRPQSLVCRRVLRLMGSPLLAC